MIFAYLGPETMLPMTSVLAGVVGFFMMFGRKMVEVVTSVFRKKAASPAPKTRARGHRPSSSRSMTPSQRSANEADKMSDTTAL